MGANAKQNKVIIMSKSLSKFITTNPKSLLFIFVVALVVSIFNLIISSLMLPQIL